MGMNYYLQRKISDEQEKVLEDAGATLPKLHIGKSSWGWRFLFRGYCFDYETEAVLHEPQAVMSFDDWNGLFSDGRYLIIDEGGDLCYHYSFREMIHLKESEKRHTYCTHYDSNGNEFLTSEFS